MAQTIKFNTNGHDDFIDFIKAYAIICVLFAHSLLPLSKLGYCIYAGIQVPLFLLVQTFHCYKKEKATVNIGKVFKRVILPFLVIESFVFVISLLTRFKDCNDLIYSALSVGGYGNGSYYPWLYLQVALLLPLFSIILKKFNKIYALLLFVLICESLEVIVSLLNISDSLYRLLAIRYILSSTLVGYGQKKELKLMSKRYCCQF